MKNQGKSIGIIHIPQYPLRGILAFLTKNSVKHVKLRGYV